MIREIYAKTMLANISHPDPWFGIKYNMNLYRGCEHQCIYCDSRSECYGIEDFHDTLVKVNAIELLRRELPSKRLIGTVGTGSMSDPYAPIERRYGLMRQALEMIAAEGFPVHIITKSDLVLRDLDLLRRINRTFAAVSFTVTTADDALSRILEPGAPVSSARLAALKTLSDAGIHTGVTMMPILPLIEDSDDNIRAIVELAYAAGARYVVPAFGMTMRNRQRAYYYDKLDQHFPGLRRRYERLYGERYSCPSPRERQLQPLFERLCAERGIPTHMEYRAPTPRREQLRLL